VKQPTRKFWNVYREIKLPGLSADRIFLGRVLALGRPDAVVRAERKFRIKKPDSQVRLVVERENKPRAGYGGQ
jgi:hypothetical protein